MHPWLVHSGTINLGTSPRILVNGMARVTPEAFGAGGNAALRMLGREHGKRRAEAAASQMEAASQEAAASERGVAAAEKKAEQEAAEQEAHLLEPPPKRRHLPSLEALAADVMAIGAAALAGPPRIVSPSSAPLWRPRVSLIVPCHNAAWCLDDAMYSVLAQSYAGAIEVSLFDDASTDSTPGLMRSWAAKLRGNGIDVVLSGSRWGPDGDPAASAGGIGFAKNASVRGSTGDVLCFLDADDMMLPSRLEVQVQALARDPQAIVGGAWVRWPAGTTAHYEAWANGMSEREMWLQQFRETTVQMPTWAILRATFERCGGFPCEPAEDLKFFHKHLDHVPWEERPLVRAGSREAPLLLYRWTASSMTSTVTRKCLLDARVAAFERRVLTQPAWTTFTVWGAGRDGKQFVASLSVAARERVVALADIDPRKVGRPYVNHQLRPVLTLPVVRPEEINGPTVVCVSLRRADESGAPGEIRKAASALGLVEGETLWYFF